MVNNCDCLDNIALIHDWLNSFTGSERCLEEIANICPGAPIYTLIYNKHKSFSNTSISKRKIFTSFIQKIPFGRKKYPLFLPFFPIAIESFDLSKYKVIISNSHCVSHGVITNNRQYHISYTNTPFRLIWSNTYEFKETSMYKNPLLRQFGYLTLSYLRLWDYAAAQRPDKLIAISKCVQCRIKKYYKRESDVIYPPVNTSLFEPKSKISKENFYIVLSRLVSHKNIELVIKTFNKYLKDEKLLIIGDGDRKKYLMKLCKNNKNITFTGFIDENQKILLLQKAKALIHPAKEDFGIVGVEALASGTPVICFAKGGTKEILNSENGVTFEHAREKELFNAINVLNSMKLDRYKIIQSSKKFDTQVFKSQFQKLISGYVDKVR